MTGLREKQTAARRRRILGAARQLIRRHGAEGFTMRELAQKSAVSPATPYNQFGSKAAILYAILQESLDELDAADRPAGPGDPLESMFRQVEAFLGQFTADSALFRSLVNALYAAGQPPRSLNERCVGLIAGVTRDALAGGLLRPELEVELFARQVYHVYLAALECWRSGELDDEGFRAQTLYGLTLCLLGASERKARPPLRERLVRLERELARLLGATGAGRPGRAARRHR